MSSFSTVFPVCVLKVQPAYAESLAVASVQRWPPTGESRGTTEARKRVGSRATQPSVHIQWLARGTRCMHARESGDSPLAGT
jgi:hypothetical protein